jgi:hypothetical protein
MGLEVVCVKRKISKCEMYVMRLGRYDGCQTYANRPVYTISNASLGRYVRS